MLHVPEIFLIFAGRKTNPNATTDSMKMFPVPVNAAVRNRMSVFSNK